MKEECYQVQLGRPCCALQALFKILTFIPRQEEATEGLLSREVTAHCHCMIEGGCVQEDK